MTELGKISTAPDGSYLFQITRRFEKPIEEVWDAISNPERIARWIAPTTFEPRAGSPILVEFEGGGTSTGHVVTFEPPKLFEYTSRAGSEGTDSLVRFELTEEAEATVLVLTHSRQTADMVARTAPGWHGCADCIEAEVRGDAVDKAAVWERVKALYL